MTEPKVKKGYYMTPESLGKTIDDARKRGTQEGIQYACHALAAAMIIVLHDKYGWRKNSRLPKFAAQVNLQFTQCLKGEITLAMLEDAAKECYPGYDRTMREE